MTKQFLVIAPHYDDEVLGCGGIIIKLIEKGYAGSVIYVTAGWSGISKLSSKKQAIQLREREAKKACKILGIKSLYFMRQEDRNFAISGKQVQYLIKAIRKIQPNIIFTPHYEESDLEHRMTYEITKEACWLAKTSYLPNLGRAAKGLETLYLYEVWTPLRKYFLKEDITDVISKKRKAMEEYRSQVKNSKLLDAIEGLNLYRGSMLSDSKKYAEVFQIEKA